MSLMTTTSHPAAADAAQRAKAVEAVIHSGRLEGFEDDPEWIAQMQLFALGQITFEKLQAFADAS